MRHTPDGCYILLVILALELYLFIATLHDVLELKRVLQNAKEYP